MVQERLNAVDTKGKFFIGRTYDLRAKKLLDEPTLYDPDDLTTHGVVVGMTGSGKTGLCVDILEEAALNNIPALLIDPKGDIANLLLHFPELRPQDFEPWVDADQARREGKTVAQVSADVADLWRGGLAKWGIESERIAAVQDAVDYAVYTPGSDAGLPISIMASLRAPDMAWDEHRELLREKISSTATALLGLVGVEADPVRSREHILLSNLFEHAWQAGDDLDLTELIRQIQNPPFKKLGAFELDQFYPDDDRFELAMALNNLLAAPSFQAWIEGATLDIQSLLWAPDGRPRHSVFYLAHLPDSERMFFVTLLLTAVEAWLRTQPGSPSLRALIYFDEVFGYLPPVANPPSKGPLLRLLKQARAFGMGLLLATQNPVDLDYKALSNAGTWMIGKLQTEQDKARLLEGLEGVDAGESGFNRAAADKAISALGKRVFLLHNVHERAPQIFHTRWAMAYLKGPITRMQLRGLNQFVGAEADGEPVAAREAAPDVSVAAEEPRLAEGTTTRSRPPSSVEEVFLPNNLTVAEALRAKGRTAPGAKQLGIVYRPALLAQADVRYLNRKINIDHEETIAALAGETERGGMIRWENVLSEPVDLDTLDRAPTPEARFAALEAPFTEKKSMKSLEKDFQDYIYHSASLRLASNAALKVVAEPGTTEEAFRALCDEAAKEAREAEEDKLRKKYEKKIKRLEDKLAKEERELAEDQAELSGRKMEEMATHAENVLGLFTGSRSSRRVTSSLTKRRMTSKAKADVEESLDEIERFKAELAEIEDELADELDEIRERWNDATEEIEETTITPKKKDIRLAMFAVAWFPYWQLQEGEETFELPGFAA
jgi:hypothetical protein